MHAQLYEAFTAAAADRSCRALVLTGAGDRAFCIGSDLGFLTEALTQMLSTMPRSLLYLRS